jgi:hypothetical protein
VVYLKKAHLWAAFCEASRSRHTVRQGAARLGVHRNTVFLWRHRLLGAVRTRGYRPPPFESVPTLPLRGRVMVGDIWFYYSEKGKRPLGRPVHAYRPQSGWLMEPRARVVLALDDGGRAIGEVAGLKKPDAGVVEATLGPHVARDAVLYSREGPEGATCVVARRLGLGWHRYVDTNLSFLSPAPYLGPDRPPDLLRYARDLRIWLGPFNGVATRYLPNYLTWCHLARARLGARVSRSDAIAWFGERYWGGWLQVEPRGTRAAKWRAQDRQ